MAVSYVANSVHVEYRQTAGRWVWRLVDFFGSEIARQGGFPTKALARTDGARAKAEYLNARASQGESRIQ